MSNKSEEDLFQWGETNPNPVEEIIHMTIKPKRIVVDLYDYQAETVKNFIKWYAGPNLEALIALTVGLGKTVTASACAEYVIASGGKVLWLTHRDELIKQSALALEEYIGEYCEIEKAQKRAHSKSSLIAASVQSLKGKRLEALAGWFKPDLIVCDEAHHALARTWMAIKTTFSSSKVLNLTATPYRSDVATRLNLGDVLIEKNTTDGIKMGKLVPPKPVGKLELNLGQVKKSLGDYETGSLSKLLCQRKVIEACTALILKHYKGRKGIIFAASVEHGKLLAEELKQHGVKSGQIYGETPLKEREGYYSDVKKGKISFLINNLVLTEGFNLPELDLVVMLRPTKNAALYLQCLGRVLRACPGKLEALVIDIIDTAKRKMAEDGYPLPTEEDRKKFSALTGRSESICTTFLSWFYSKEEAHLISKGELSQAESSRMTSGEDVYSALLGKPKAGWGSYQQRIIGEIDHLIAHPVKPQNPKDIDGLETLFTSIRCGNSDSFIRLMGGGGWRYYPHNQIPVSEELFEDSEQEFENFNEEGTTFNFEALISEDAELRNFIVDIFGDEKDLGEQAKKYYELHRIEGQPVIWYKPVGIKNANFHFIETKKKGHFWIRTPSSKVFIFTSGGGFISNRPFTPLKLEDVQPFNLSTRWGEEKMSEKQAVQVAKILEIPEAELASANISRLSASAVMSAHFTKRYLSRIAAWLLKNAPESLIPDTEIEQQTEVIATKAENKEEETLHQQFR